MNEPLPTADWYPDPLDRHEYRYWDGGSWTENVASSGVATLDPIWTMPASTTLEESPHTGEVPFAIEAATVADLSAHSGAGPGGPGGPDPYRGAPGYTDLAFGGGAGGGEPDSRPAPPATEVSPLSPSDPTAYAGPAAGGPGTGAEITGQPGGPGPVGAGSAPAGPPSGGFAFLDPSAPSAPNAPPAYGGPSAAEPVTGKVPIGRHDAGTGEPGGVAGPVLGGARPRNVPVRRPPSKNRAFVLILAGALLAVVMGVYGSVHDPGQPRFEPPLIGFDNFLKFKVWMTTLFLVLAVVQALISARMYGKIKVPKRRPRWLGDAHRLIGTLVLLISLPIAYHCLWIFGFKTTDTGGDTSIRVLLHSVAGCAFYGAYLTKVLSVRTRRLPRWMLPYAGGAVFASLVLLFATSSAYVFVNDPGSVF